MLVLSLMLECCSTALHLLFGHRAVVPLMSGHDALCLVCVSCQDSVLLFCLGYGDIVQLLLFDVGALCTCPIFGVRMLLSDP